MATTKVTEAEKTAIDRLVKAVAADFSPKLPPLFTTDPSPASMNTIWRGFNWGHWSIVAPWVSPYDTTREHIETFAAKCQDGAIADGRIYPKGGPAVFEYEHYQNPTSEKIPADRRRPDFTLADPIRIFKEHVGWFKAAAPDVPIAIAGIESIQDDPAYQQMIDPLFEAADYILPPDTYLPAAEWYSRDIARMGKRVVAARKKWPKKPFYFAICPYFIQERADNWVEADGPGNRVSKLMPASYAARYLKYVMGLVRPGDTIVAWGAFADTDAVFSPHLPPRN